jgi:hypothetical protein
MYWTNIVALLASVSLFLGALYFVIKRDSALARVLVFAMILLGVVAATRFVASLDSRSKHIETLD